MSVLSNTLAPTVHLHPRNETLSTGPTISDIQPLTIASLGIILIIMGLCCLMYWGCANLHDKQSLYSDDSTSPSALISDTEVMNQSDINQPLLSGQDVEYNNHKI